MPHIVFVVFPPDFEGQIERLKVVAGALIKNGASTEIFYAEKFGGYSEIYTSKNSECAERRREKSDVYSENIDILEEKCVAGGELILLAVADFTANQTLSRLACRLDTECLTNVFRFFEEDGAFFAERKVCGSNVDMRISIGKTTDIPVVITVAAAEKTERIALVGGRGLHSKYFERLQKLAEKMGGQAFLTRAAALDMQSFLEKQTNSEKTTKIQPSKYIVGQSGRTVAPDVCITFGVSGAAAFMAGVSQAKKLIAVNTDRDAPIFSYADFGIVADAEEILTEFEKIAEEF
jgi:electron transfer flavoprotein alpha subunit